MQNRIFLNSLNHGVIILDTDLRVRFWNAWLCAYTGVEVDPDAGSRLDVLFPEVDVRTLKRKIKNALTLKTPSFIDASVSHYLFKIPVDKITYSSFEYMQQNVTIAPYDLEAGLVSLMIYDQTPLLEMKQRLMGFNRELEQRVKAAVEENRRKDMLLQQQSKQAAMGEMISAIAHQWRQPLNSIYAIAQDFEDAFEHGEIDKEYVSEISQEMSNQIDYMSQTIEDFRNFFKHNRSKVYFSPVETVKQVFVLLSSQLKGSTIGYALTNDLPKEGKLFGYENDLKQVLIILINNARDAIVAATQKGVLSHGGGNVSIHIKDGENGETVILVMDNAGGIDPKNLEKIFEPYFTTKPDDKGTGIGLFIARRIIEGQFDGTITAENTADGAMFILRLPHREA